MNNSQAILLSALGTGWMLVALGTFMHLGDALDLGMWLAPGMWVTFGGATLFLLLMMRAYKHRVRW